MILTIPDREDFLNSFLTPLSRVSDSAVLKLTKDNVSDIIANGLGKPANIVSQPGTSTQGSTNDANTPGATATDYLYSMADQGTVKIQIVGDPAWLLQGEVKGINAHSVNFNGFYPDGTVCYETQEVIFAINFNAPADYNNAPGSGGPAGGTGLIDTVSRSSPINSASGSTQASAAFRATTIKSTFSKGSFTQELNGTALTNLNAKQIADASNGRSVKGSTGGNGTVRSNPNGTASTASAPALASAASPNAVADQGNAPASGSPTDTPSAPSNNVAGPPTTNSNPPGPVTSNGKILENGNTIVGNSATQTTTQQVIAAGDDSGT
jgi:hypothetical protein